MPNRWADAIFVDWTELFKWRAYNSINSNKSIDKANAALWIMGSLHHRCIGWRFLAIDSDRLPLCFLLFFSSFLFFSLFFSLSLSLSFSPCVCVCVCVRYSFRYCSVESCSCSSPALCTQSRAYGAEMASIIMLGKMLIKAPALQWEWLQLSSVMKCISAPAPS